MKPLIIDLDEKNIEQYPPVCFLNPKNAGYLIKKDWLLKRFAEELKIKLLYFENDKKCHGFIEYIPGEYAWRAVDAKEYLFIHCIWITPNDIKKKGYGSLLVRECLDDARKQGKLGAAVITSTGAFMADKGLFLKNGFKEVETQGDHSLLVYHLKKGPLPRFKDWKSKLSSYTGLHIIYSNQCPWVSRFMTEVDAVLKDQGMKIDIKELKTAREAQEAPSIYATFNLINHGKLLADHYISLTRFKNILNKEFPGKK
ncbi:MAG: GNAT family N-acetyltransferase [Candidatus Aminicenantes bacterium]|nr:GNAT family N-acetyltransferase [Candidatus Aminicenantes bacterium]